jgi:hypothetical protein
LALAVVLVGALAAGAVAQWTYMPGILTTGEGRLSAGWGPPGNQLQLLGSRWTQELDCLLQGNGYCDCPWELKEELFMFDTVLGTWRLIAVPNGNPQWNCGNMAAGNPPAWVNLQQNCNWGWLGWNDYWIRARVYSNRWCEDPNGQIVGRLDLKFTIGG